MPKDRISVHMKTFASIKSILTNLLAGLFPKVYMVLVEETGRGGECSSQDELEHYCLEVLNDYLRMLGEVGICDDSFLKDKVILEYGPGDCMGVALLFLLKGARKVCCVDRFPLRDDKKYHDLYNRMVAAHIEPQDDHISWSNTFEHKIFYTASSDGMCILPEKADIIVSRAVLEHCNDLDKTFDNMGSNLKPGGIMIHKVDLTSHGTHYRECLDFLCYSRSQWTLMTCFKGYPNRCRRNVYLELLDKYGYGLLHSESVYGYSPSELSGIRRRLSWEFRNLEKKDLLCSDYFFVAKKRA